MHRSSIATVAMVALLWLPGVASAATILTQATPTTWTLISDGTSNTILLSELSSLDVCVPSTSVPPPSVPPSSDGSSNTLLLSETSAIGVVWSSSNFGAVDGTSNTILIGDDFCYRGIQTPTPIGQITDGTSNTILFPENPIDVRDGSFDVCFARVGITTITDGTSNTIQIGANPRCFQDVALVPAPAALSVSAMALLASLWRGRRRQQ